MSAGWMSTFLQMQNQNFQVLKMERIKSELLKFRKLMSKIQGAEINVHIYSTQAKCDISQFRWTFQEEQTSQTNISQSRCTPLVTWHKRRKFVISWGRKRLKTEAKRREANRRYAALRQIQSSKRRKDFIN